MVPQFLEYSGRYTLWQITNRCMHQVCPRPSIMWWLACPFVDHELHQRALPYLGQYVWLLLKYIYFVVAACGESCKAHSTKGEIQWNTTIIRDAVCWFFSAAPMGPLFHWALVQIPMTLWTLLTVCNPLSTWGRFPGGAVHVYNAAVMSSRLLMLRI